MKVKDLIAKLQDMDPDALVAAEDGEFGPYVIDDVRSGFLNRDCSFVPLAPKLLEKRPKTYKSAILLY